MHELRDALLDSVCAGLEKNGIIFDKPASRAYSSPRRLALLLKISRTFLQMADFSRITT